MCFLPGLALATKLTISVLKILTLKYTVLVSFETSLSFEKKLILIKIFSSDSFYGFFFFQIILVIIISNCKIPYSC